MLQANFAVFISLLLYAASGNAVASLEDRYTTCKSVPGSASWPSPDIWRSFNDTLQGALLAPLPPAVACDPSNKSYYNNATCSRVTSQWSNSSFHASDPVSVDWPIWQDDACLPSLLPNATPTCNTDVFPHYVVNATTADHVATAVKFAAQYQVRLSVKGTGHDYLGRSTSLGLSIWTHNIRGIELDSAFKPQSCATCAGTSALTVFAGHRWGEVYTRAAADNLTVVGGADANVGVGGYLTGGGHSPISAKFGLATDNVLETKVVSPTGEVLVANDYQNIDLFWAIRGGGGSTFGVLISATLKTFPMPLARSFILSINSTEAEASGNNNNTNWYSSIAFLYTQFPALARAGLMGYFYSAPISLADSSSEQAQGPITGPPVASGPLAFAYFGWVLDQPESSIRTAFAPTMAKLNSTAGLHVALIVKPATRLYNVIGQNADTVGRNVRLGSRLWDEKALSDQAAIDLIIRKLIPTSLNGLLVTGPGVWAVGRDSSAANPAWRTTVAHLTVAVSFPFRAAPATEAIITDYLTNTLVKTLRDHAPDTGCYINESDADEPDYQHAFWGDHYDRLLAIKRAYDPEDVFWCKVCVGGERWKVVDDGDKEGTGSGEVCRVG